MLPSWAQKTLKAHNGDRRELKTMEQLELGTTGDEIWDALQHQLNKTGLRSARRCLTCVWVPALREAESLSVCCLQESSTIMYASFPLHTGF